MSAAVPAADVAFPVPSAAAAAAAVSAAATTEDILTIPWSLEENTIHSTNTHNIFLVADIIIVVTDVVVDVDVVDVVVVVVNHLDDQERRPRRGGGKGEEIRGDEKGRRGDNNELAALALAMLKTLCVLLRRLSLPLYFSLTQLASPPRINS